MNIFRNERGQATVLTVLCLTVLLGMAALVLDLGSWYQAQRATQSAADAAALAAAQATPDDPDRAAALATEYLAKNGGGTHRTLISHQIVDNDTVTVEVDRDAPGFFAKVFGVDSVEVGARATARASGIDEARWAAPITVNIKHPALNCGSTNGRPDPCFGQPTELDLLNLHKSGSGDAAGAFGLINLNRSDTGTAGASTLAEWIAQGFDEYMAIGIYKSVPSAMFNDVKFREALDLRVGDVLLFPIYKTILGSGSNAEYDVVGWVGFEVSSFDAGGNSGKVRGSFTKVIWEGVQSTSGAGLNYGVRTIQLIE